MSHQAVGRMIKTAALTAVFALLGAAPALADQVRINLREGRSVIDPSTHAYLVQDGAFIQDAHVKWLVVTDVTAVPGPARVYSNPWNATGQVVNQPELDAALADSGSDLNCRPLDWRDPVTNLPIIPDPAAHNGTIDPRFAAAYSSYPNNCNWPSIHAIAAGTPQNANIPDPLHPGDSLQTSGEVDVTNPSSFFMLPSNNATTMSDLPAGKYFLTDWADGYEVSGASFVVKCGVNPETGSGYTDASGAPCTTQDDPNVVDVFNQATPLPYATMRVDVFQDTSSVNGEYDRDTEVGLNGFKAIINDITGEAVTIDAYGNQICSDYWPIMAPASLPAKLGNGLYPNVQASSVQPLLDGDGLSIYQLYYPNHDPAKDHSDDSGNVFGFWDSAGVYHEPDPQAVGHWKDAAPELIQGSGGICLSRSVPEFDPETGDAIPEPLTRGHIIIRNLEPGRYASTVSPPDNPQRYSNICPTADTLANNPIAHHPVWSQTTTLEGTHDWDQWIMAGDTGYDHEMVNGTEKVTPVTSGWICETSPLSTFNGFLSDSSLAAAGGFPAGVVDGAVTLNPFTTVAQGPRNVDTVLTYRLQVANPGFSPAPKANDAYSISLPSATGTVASQPGNGTNTITLTAPLDANRGMLVTGNGNNLSNQFARIVGTSGSTLTLGQYLWGGTGAAPGYGWLVTGSTNSLTRTFTNVSGGSGRISFAGTSGTSCTTNNGCSGSGNTRIVVNGGQISLTWSSTANRNTNLPNVTMNAGTSTTAGWSVTGSVAAGSFIVSNQTGSTQTAFVTGGRGVTVSGGAANANGSYSFSASGGGASRTITFTGNTTPPEIWIARNWGGTRPAAGATATVTRAALVGLADASGLGAIHGTVVDSFSYTASPIAGNHLGFGDAAQGIVRKEPQLEIALDDLLNNDTTIYQHPFFKDDKTTDCLRGTGVARCKPGEFLIDNVPPGSYSLTVWDFAQNELLYSQNVTVTGGDTNEVDQIPLIGWGTEVSGTVFTDTNGNGKQDPGEKGIPGFVLTNRARENTLFEQGTNFVTTDQNGHYTFRALYPVGQWTVLEAYMDGFYTTGITAQSGNEKVARQYGSGDGAVDVNISPMFSQGVTVDWGKRPYAKGTNGGIVGSISYGTTRNETNPAEFAAEDWQPGIPNIMVHAFRAWKVCATNTTTDCAIQTSDVGNDSNPDGSVLVLGVTAAGVEMGVNQAGAIDNDTGKTADALHATYIDSSGALVDTRSFTSLAAIDAAAATNTWEIVRPADVSPQYRSEQWDRPVDCTTLDGLGNPLATTAMPWQPEYFNTPGTDRGCVEGPGGTTKIGVYLPGHDSTPNWGSTVNGNYGFGSEYIQFAPDFTSNPVNPPSAGPATVVYTNHGTVAVDATITAAADGTTTVDGNPLAAGDSVDVTVAGDGGVYAPPGIFTVTYTTSAPDIQVPIEADDYVVKIDVPTDHSGTPVYDTTKEEDVNVYTQDAFQQPNPGAPVPTALKYECAGPLHTVDVAGVLTDGYPAGPNYPASNPTGLADFADTGGSPFEGQQKPLCASRNIHLDNGHSVAPLFELFTAVPAPGVHFGVMMDDLNVNVNPLNTFYGDQLTIKGLPVSWYDFSGRLMKQTTTDANGFYEVMLPTTDRIAEASPSGVSAAVYNIVANDPASPDTSVPVSVADPRPMRPNPNFQHQYNSPSGPFQLYPGDSYVTDLALITTSTSVDTPGTIYTHPAQCLIDPATPQVFAADNVVGPAGGSTFTLKGLGFGTAPTVQLVNEDTGGLLSGNVTGHVNGVAPVQTASGTVQAYGQTGTVTFGIARTGSITGGTSQVTFGTTQVLPIGGINLNGAEVWSGTTPIGTVASVSTISGNPRIINLVVPYTGATLTNVSITLPNVAGLNNGQNFSVGDWLVTSGTTVADRLSGQLLKSTGSGTPNTRSWYVLDPTTVHFASGSTYPTTGGISYARAQQNTNLTITVSTIPTGQNGGTFRWTSLPASDTGSATINQANTPTQVRINPGSQRPPLQGASFQILTAGSNATVTIAASGIATNGLSGRTFNSGGVHETIVSNTATSGGNVVLTFTPTTVLTTLGSTYTIDLSTQYTSGISPGFTVGAHGDSSVTFTTPNVIAGPYQVFVTNNDLTSGQRSINAVTLHLRGTGYSPVVYDVGKGFPFDPTLAPIEGTVSSYNAGQNRVTATASVFGPNNSLAGLEFRITTGAGVGFRATVVANTGTTITFDAVNQISGPYDAAGTFTPANGDTFRVIRARGIQSAIDAAARVPAVLPNAAAQPLLDRGDAGGSLIVVHPSGIKNGYNPRGAYFENVVIPKGMKVQGVGPGGSYPAAYTPDTALQGTSVLGALVDGSTFLTKDSGRYPADWYNRALYYQSRTGNTSELFDSEVFYVLGSQAALSFNSNGTATTYTAANDVTGGSSITLTSAVPSNAVGAHLSWTDPVDGGTIVRTITSRGGSGNRTANLDQPWPANAAALPLAGDMINISVDAFTQSYKAAIDGLAIEGGNALSQPGFLNQNGGGPLSARLAAVGTPVSQGGGIFVDSDAHYLQIRNNALKSNAGIYGGAVRIGTPDLAETVNGITDFTRSSHNDHITIANNQVHSNGGTTRAGAIGLFNGSDSYQITRNDICGNYSAEYGAGISHYGYSPNGLIENNRVYFNQSYDEGAGIMIAGQLPAQRAIPNAPIPPGFTQGAGTVKINANVIQGNIANDDGGGLRFLQAATGTASLGQSLASAPGFLVTNNQIVDNVSTHEGGGVAIDDTAKLSIIGNTIVNNKTTATAMTSNGSPAPAGISMGNNSLQFMGYYGVGSSTPPTLIDDILWNNLAGTYDVVNGTVTGIGLPGDPLPADRWDLGSVDVGPLMAPTYSIYQSNGHGGVTLSGTNRVDLDPLFVNGGASAAGLGILLQPMRANPHFVGNMMVALDWPATRLGNYKLLAGSPAIDSGAANAALTTDIDFDGRPIGSGYDRGADEYNPSGSTSMFVPRISGRTLSVTARSAPAVQLPDAQHSLVGGLAPQQYLDACANCRPSLQVKVGSRIHTYRMRASGPVYTASVGHLANGTYRVRVVYTNTITHRATATAWRKIKISMNRKGAK